MSGKTGKNVKTEDEITAALDELEEREQEENDDVFYSFHKFTINEEDEPLENYSVSSNIKLARQLYDLTVERVLL